MDRINVLNRNLDEVNEFDNAASRNVIEIIKLTSGSYNAIASENDRQLSIINENKENNKIVETNIQPEDSTFELYSVEWDNVIKANGIKTKAIKETQSMIDNSDKKYGLVLPKIDVNNVDSKEIADVVENNFDFYNIDENYNAEDVPTNDNNITPTEEEYRADDYYQEIPEDTAIPEATALDSLMNTNVVSDTIESEGFENESTKEIENTSSEDTIIPQIQNFFMEHDLNGVIDSNNEVSETPNKEISTDNLFEQISNEIDTASDISELSQKLSAIISMNKQLTSANEQLNREKEAALNELTNATEQQYEAEKRKAAADDEFKNMIDLYQQKNEALEEKNNKEREEINEVKAKTEEVKTNVISLEKYSSGIIDMLSDYGYGSSNENVTKDTGISRVA